MEIARVARGATRADIVAAWLEHEQATKNLNEVCSIESSAEEKIAACQRLLEAENNILRFPFL